MGAGTPLLFLHGAGLPASTFRELILFLARDNEVLVPEIPGFGRSDFPDRHWDFATYARLMRRLLDERGSRIRRMVGYSFGGGIALQLAPMLPDLESLVLLSPAEGGERYRHAGVLARVAWEAVGSLRISMQKGTTLIYAGVARDYVLNSFRWTLFQRRLLRVVVRCFRRSRGCCPTDVPAVVLTADADVFFPGAAASLRAVLPGAQFRTLAGMRLWPLLDPARVQREIGRVFSESDQASRISV